MLLLTSSLSYDQFLLTREFVVVVFQLLSHVRLFVTPRTAACQAIMSSLSLRFCSNSCPLCWWCHSTISSVTPFSSCPQSFPASVSLLFQWVSFSHQVAKVLEFQLQYQSFQWIFRTDFLYDGLVGSPCSPRDSQEFSNTIVQKNQFFGPQLSL